jgi:hypothetical protein
MADYNSPCARTEIVHVFHFKPCHGQAFGKIIYRVIHLDQFS